jgi:hypothetical protein
MSVCASPMPFESGALAQFEYNTLAATRLSFIYCLACCCLHATSEAADATYPHNTEAEVHVT